jgi:hypothetical protein
VGRWENYVDLGGGKEQDASESFIMDTLDEVYSSQNMFSSNETNGMYRVWERRAIYRLPYSPTQKFPVTLWLFFSEFVS